MSRSRSKVTYKCDELCQMGGCEGKRGVLLLLEEHGCDMFNIVSVKHADDEKPDISTDMIGSDNMWAALHDLVNRKDGVIEDWDDQDHDFHRYAMLPQRMQVWPLPPKE